MQQKEKKKRGFALMDPQERSKIARLGGQEAHRKGTAHRFTTAEAREAGRKGGKSKHIKSKQ
jgi:general stress protein YciG